MNRKRSKRAKQISVETSGALHVPNPEVETEISKRGQLRAPGFQTMESEMNLPAQTIQLPEAILEY